VKNRTHKTGNYEYTKLINKALSDLWEVPTPEQSSISGPFTPKGVASVLKHLDPKKSPGLDFIFPEFILHTRSAHKSW